MIDKAHAKLSPSAAHRWMSCPGSIALCEKYPKIESKYADEGTAAHRLGEFCLKAGKDFNASIYIGKKVKVDRDIKSYDERKLFEVDSDMAEAVQVYLDVVRNTFIDDAERKMGVETSFDLSWLYNGMFGSNDAYVYSPKNKTIAVFDYKHGKGVIVEPEWNPQLMIYALGALYTVCKAANEPVFSKIVEKIQITIVQPRALHSDVPVKNWMIDTIDLLFWAHNVLIPCAIKTEKKDAGLMAGDHCQFCNAKAACPEMRNQAVALAKVAFDDDVVHFPDVSDFGVDTIAKIMAMSSAFKEWLKAVDEQAFQLLESGVKIPGYKLVQKKADRKWIDETNARLALRPILGDELYETKILSPAKAEKALTAKGVSKYTINGLWEKPETGLTIAPDSDKREAIQSTTAAIDFIDDADWMQ